MDDYSYSGGRRLRGKALIICNGEFAPETARGRRLGAEKDCHLLVNLFTILGFDLLVLKNATSLEILKEAKKLCLADHSEHDCVVVAVSTHGASREQLSKQTYGMDGVVFYEEMDMLYGTDSAFDVEALTQLFDETHCPSLAGKPKLFFFQGCRGSQFATTVRVNDSRLAQSSKELYVKSSTDKVIHSLDSTLVMTKVPKVTACGEDEYMGLVTKIDDDHTEMLTQFEMMDPDEDPAAGVAMATCEKIVSRKMIIARDFLTMWSSPPGYFAFHTSEGSPFIRVLCEVLLAGHDEADLLSMLTEVNWRVARDYESQTEEECSNRRHIVPSIEHMLRKQIYL